MCILDMKHNEKEMGFDSEERRKAAEIFSLWRKFQRSSKGEFFHNLFQSVVILLFIGKCA